MKSTLRGHPSLRKRAARGARAPRALAALLLCALLAAAACLPQPPGGGGRAEKAALTLYASR